MPKLATLVVCACSLAALAAFGREQPERESSRSSGAEPQISVLVFDYAGVGGILGAAEREAARILSAARLNVVFRRCPESPRELISTPACASPRPPGILVHILPGSATRLSTEPSAFGFAVPAGEEYPDYACVFFDRVETLSRTGRVHPATILGAVMAHEMGHLLLGSGAHAPPGIMTAHWGPKELGALGQGRLLFSHSQAKRIQLTALRRNAGE